MSRTDDRPSGTFEVRSADAAPEHAPSAGATPPLLVRELLHELRGPLVALEAALALLQADHARELGAGGRELLSVAESSAGRLATLEEALSLLASGGARRGASLADVLARTAARWKKFLSRRGFGLNLLGDLPDRNLDERAAGLVLDAFLEAGVALLKPGSGGELTLSAADRGSEVHVRLALPGGREASADWTDVILPDGLLGLARRSAFERLSAVARLEAGDTGPATLVLAIPAGGAR